MLNLACFTFVSFQPITVTILQFTGTLQADTSATTHTRCIWHSWWHFTQLNAFFPHGYYQMRYSLGINITLRDSGSSCGIIIFNPALLNSACMQCSFFFCSPFSCLIVTNCSKCHMSWRCFFHHNLTSSARDRANGMWKRVRSIMVQQWRLPTFSAVRENRGHKGRVWEQC